jgi:GTPase SAR1 family protein
VPTVGFNSTTVTNPLSNEKNDRNDKNKNQQRIKIIDVSGQKKYRQQSWSQYYDQIHGLIFVIDASESDRLSENQETLEDLLKNEKLKDKPILM